MSEYKKMEECVVAKEDFTPYLNEPYNTFFQELIYKLQNSLSINRISIIDAELRSRKGDEIGDIECWKYLAVLSLMKDLSQQGWIFEVEDNKLMLSMETENVDDKKMLRYRLNAERMNQFKQQSICDFIKQMEMERIYNNEKVSIRNLIGDPTLLIKAIEEGNKVCEPYIQMVTDSKDVFTGFKLSQIWRYFRYTWSIPYKTMPGRNLYYLVRDKLQPCHPVIGIFALGNSVLNLTVRDNDIGWTIAAISKNMKRLTSVEYCEQKLSDTNGKSVKVKVERNMETFEDYLKRASEYADLIMPLLTKNINEAINDIYVKDLGYHKQTKFPKQEQVDSLNQIAIEYGKKAINNKNNIKSPNWEEEARSNLFTRKRASELAKLLTTKITFNEVSGSTNFEKLNNLLSTENGRKAINAAMIATRKSKIGSNMMEIIVCGAIPPYNELLGGKLVSMLACSPTVIRDYTVKYSGQVSEIASRMKGQKVIRDSKLVYLGTTSLYAIGSSQYNRINVPMEKDFSLKFRKMGITEGFGTVFFSSDTTELFSSILEAMDGGRRINNVFGEGTSPRFRMISRGLASLGIRADKFLKHHSPRIVYSINLARNTNRFLLGLDEFVDYAYDINDSKSVETNTQNLIDYWYARWMEKRLTTVDVKERLKTFKPDSFLLGKL